MHLTSLFLASRGGGSSFDVPSRSASYLLVTRSMYSNPPRSGAPRKFKCKMSAEATRAARRLHVGRREWSLACLQGPIGV